MQISRIRLSDKTSRLRPRLVAPPCGQTYEPEVPVEVREWIAPAPASPELVLVAQPPAQPRCGVVVERAIRRADGAYLEVVRPAAQRAVQLRHLLRGLLPTRLQVGQVMDLLDHAANALLGRPHAQSGLAGRLRIHPPERVTQEVELSFRDLADSCLLLVDRQLQLAHDLAHSGQGLFGLALPAQDHEIVGVGHDPAAKALLQPELLPPQHEPAHVQIGQQW